jgi:hypothetical protein
MPGVIQVTAKVVTLYTKKGSLSGTASATQTTNPDGTGTITDGKLTLDKGTGAYKGHQLVATFTGTFKDMVFTFKTTGTYR